MLTGDSGKGVVRIVFALGLVALLTTAAAVWVELRGPRRATTAALLRRAFVALVAAWLWTVFPQQDLIVGRPLPKVFGAVAATVFSGLGLFAHVADARLPRAHKIFDLALSSAAVAVLLLELGLQVVAQVSHHPMLARVQSGRDDELLHALRLVPGAPHFGGPANSMGFIDDEFGAERKRPRRVVSIGDSFSVGVVPHPYHYTTVAEEVLGDTEILNLGVPGIGPPQYRVLLESDGLALAPDLIVIGLFAGNDLETYRLPTPPGLWSWMERRNVMLYLAWRRGRAVLLERARRGADTDAIERGLGRGLASGLRKDELERELPHLVDPTLERPIYSPEHHLTMELRRARLQGRPSEAEYATLRDQLDALVATAGEVPIAFLLLPDEFQVDDALWAELLAAADGEELERDRFQRVVADWGASRGVPVYDMLPELRATPPWSDGRPHLYHLRDTHFNARGNRAAGEALARFLAGVLPSPSVVSGR